MTRDEQRLLKEQKEKEFIEKYRGKPITGEIKNKFRTFDIWKNFRKFMYIKEIKKLKNGKEKIIPNVDCLTLRPLKKTFQNHHCDSDSSHYFDLNPEQFRTLNAQSHEIVHIIYSEMCKDRNYMKRLSDIIEYMGELNNWVDFK